jgi:hypothetical protein
MRDKIRTTRCINALENTHYNTRYSNAHHPRYNNHDILPLFVSSHLPPELTAVPALDLDR